MTMPNELYRYRASVTHVYDGDSFTCDIHLGFGVVLSQQKIRLARVNTPEIRGGTEETKAAGRTSRNRVKDLILGHDVLLCTYKDKGKFGRWVADVTTPGGEDLSDLLIVEGLAEPYKE